MSDPKICKFLSDEFKGAFSEKEDLKHHTTFRLGGPAEYFIRASNEDVLKKAVNFAIENELKYYVIGGGSNLIVNDKGVGGLVIKMTGSKMDFGSGSVSVWAGTPLADLVSKVSASSWTGLEWAAGIPGTVGGAIYGNAGAYGSAFSDSVKSVTVFINGGFEIWDKEKAGFFYRDSAFKKDSRRPIILKATLDFKMGTFQNVIDAKIADIRAKRKERLPSEPSAGCVFKNVKIVGADFWNAALRKIMETEQGKEYLKRGVIPAGYLIESAGLKGQNSGGIYVSEKHANFLVREINGSASSENFLDLIGRIKSRIKDTYLLTLEEEVQYLGFEEKKEGSVIPSVL